MEVMCVIQGSRAARGYTHVTAKQLIGPSRERLTRNGVSREAKPLCPARDGRRNPGAEELDPGEAGAEWRV